MIKRIFQIVLWLGAVTYGVAGVVAMTHAQYTSGTAGSLSRAYFVFGSLFLIIAVLAAVTTSLVKQWLGWLIVATAILCLGVPIGLFAAFWIDMEKGEVHRRAFEEEIQSCRYAFGDQPASVGLLDLKRAGCFPGGLLRCRPAAEVQ